MPRQNARQAGCRHRPQSAALRCKGHAATLTAVDLSSGMLREASKAPSRLPVELLQMNAAEALKFADASFDAVLDTFLALRHGDPAAAPPSRCAACPDPSGRVVPLEHCQRVDGECGARLAPGRDCWRGEQARRQGLRLQPARRGAPRAAGARRWRRGQRPSPARSRC